MISFFVSILLRIPVEPWTRSFFKDQKFNSSPEINYKNYHFIYIIIIIEQKRTVRERGASFSLARQKLDNQ